MPRTRQEWLDMNGHEFAERVCSLNGWEVNPKKSNDKGIDGWANNRQVPIQIKNHHKNIGRADVQKFVGAMNGSSEGIFVAWGFAPSVHDYVLEARESFGKIVQLKKVDEIIGDLVIPFDKMVEIEQLFKPYKRKVAA